MLDKPKYFHPDSRCQEYARDLALFALPRIVGPQTVEDVEAKIRVLAECHELLVGLPDADSWFLRGLFYGRSPQKKHGNKNRILDKWTSDALEVIRKSDRFTDDGRRAALAKLADLYEQKRRRNNIINLVELLGVDALCIEPVIEELRRLQHQGAHGLRERRESRKRLKKLIDSLLPDSRGKRANILAVSTSKVKLYYYEELFRIYHIENALRNFPGTLRNKVKVASENYELSVETIKDLWKLNDSYTPICSPVSRKEMARILTARHFSITQHRVSNILAS
jgi:hypothetical protein